MQLNCSATWSSWTACLKQADWKQGLRCASLPYCVLLTAGRLGRGRLRNYHLALPQRLSQAVALACAVNNLKSQSQWCRSVGQVCARVPSAKPTAGHIKYVHVKTMRHS